MKSLVLGIALLLGGTAMAQTTTSGTMDNNGNMATQSQPASDQTQTGWTANNGQPAMATTTTASTGSVVQPDNSNPRRDARGIPVISMAAVVPAGWNGTAGSNTGMGGPLLDPNTGQPVSDTASVPACSRTVTDRCVQTYERHRR